MLKTIIVAHDEVSVKRLKNKFSTSNEIELCRTFQKPREAYEYVRKHEIQLAFLDFSVPEIQGMRISSLFHEQDSSYDESFVTRYDDYAVHALDLGALKYLMKFKGRNKDEGSAMDAEQEKLTQKEITVLQFISTGMSNKQIAKQLNVSAETIKSHIKNIYRKLNVNNRIQAVQALSDNLHFEIN